jgi:hypothetical protein
MDGATQMGHEGKYGFGKERTLRDYEKYAGLLFSKRAVQQYTLDKKYAPNPYDFNTEKEWIDSFSSVFKHCIDLYKPKLDEPDYDFWAVIFEDESGKEIYRKDADKNEINSIMSKQGDFVNVWREFNTTIKPQQWVVWTHTTSKGWGERLTGKL